MSGLSVTVAAYGSLDAAQADLAAFELAIAPGNNDVIDALLVEIQGHQVCDVHSWAIAGWGGGVIASAVVVALSPSVMTTGALAGGVGARVMFTVGRGLSRDATGELGRVLDAGRFVIAAVADRRDAPHLGLLSTRALRFGRLPMSTTGRQLRDALDADQEDDLGGEDDL